MVKRTPDGAQGRRSARLESAAERTLPEPSTSNEQDVCSDTSRSSSEASETAFVAAISLPQAASKKRAKRTPFCLDFHEEQLMCEFLRENAILWDIKNNGLQKSGQKEQTVGGSAERPWQICCTPSGLVQVLEGHEYAASQEEERRRSE